MRKLTILLARSDAEMERARQQGIAAARSLDEAVQLAPWAAEWMELDGLAWIAFEDVEDARIAQQQT